MFVLSSTVSVPGESAKHFAESDLTPLGRSDVLLHCCQSVVPTVPVYVAKLHVNLELIRPSAFEMGGYW